MSRPTELDLTGPNPEWRDVPMPGANEPFALRRLDSAPGAFVVHGRFPAGFERTRPGGYAVAEEFLVLDGGLEIEGESYGRGALTYVPARFLRTRMRSEVGCTVLAWFAGPAEFRPAAELDDPVTAGIRTVDLTAPSGALLEVPESRWTSLADGERVDLSAPADVVDVRLTTWRRVSGEAVGPLLLRCSA